jgi:hypothetical protein
VLREQVVLRKLVSGLRLDRYFWLSDAGGHGEHVNGGSRLRLIELHGRLSLHRFALISNWVVVVFLIGFLLGGSLNLLKSFSEQVLELLDVVRLWLASAVVAHIIAIFRPRLT